MANRFGQLRGLFPPWSYTGRVGYPTTGLAVAVGLPTNPQTRLRQRSMSIIQCF